MLLNLFLAVLLDGFSVNADEEDDRIHDEMSLNKKQMPITNTEIDYDA